MVTALIQIFYRLEYNVTDLDEMKKDIAELIENLDWYQLMNYEVTITDDEDDDK